MRTLFLAFVLVTGCTQEVAPNTLLDGGASLDGHIAETPTCTTACDCQAGLGCSGGRCVAGTTDTYCCEAATCPTGSSCQSSSGAFATCGGGGVNGTTGGAPGTGTSGGTIGGLGGTIGGLGGFDLDGGLGGIIGGLSGGSTGGLPSDDGGTIGGLTGGTTGGGGFCDFIPCSDDNTCIQLGCALCGTSGKCE
jgi:hypothetical protein